MNKALNAPPGEQKPTVQSFFDGFYARVSKRLNNAQGCI